MTTATEIKPNVFNINDRKEFYSYEKDVPLKNPWTFSVMIDGIEYFPLIKDSGGANTAFSTMDQAITAARNWKLPKNSIFIVTTDNSSGDGRANNRLHKVFKSMKNAHEYIMKQEGIYVKEQSKTLSFGCNIYGGAYASHNYNGYAIEILQIEDAE